MKVNQRSLDQTASSQLARSQGTSGTTSGGDRSGASRRSGGDQVEVSQFSSQLLALARADSPGRAAYVDQLAAAVSAGQYNPDSLQTSRGIIAEAFGNVS
jgi:anti-sigma28 factor (negative regulator of flagellin synthesis)